MTENELKYEAYLKPATVQVDGHELKVLVAHAWMLVLDAHLDIKIPAEKISDRWGIDDSDVALRDFSLNIIDVEGDSSLLMLSARDAKPYLETYQEAVQVGQDENSNDVVEMQEFERIIYPQRKAWTTADDLHVWATELEAFGYGFDDLLTDKQAQALQEAE
jgi:hypothetical protein